MYTVEAARGHGVGRAMVDHLLSVAAERHYQRVSLETGVIDAFAPARNLYMKIGFRLADTLAGDAAAYPAFRGR